MKLDKIKHIKIIYKNDIVNDIKKMKYEILLKDIKLKMITLLASISFCSIKSLTISILQFSIAKNNGVLYNIYI